MAIKQMQVANNNQGSEGIRSFDAYEMLDLPGEGSWFIVPDETNGAAVTLKCSGTNCRGYIETTTSSYERIKNGNEIPIKWTRGDVLTVACGVCESVSAFRMVNVGGTVEIEARTI